MAQRKSERVNLTLTPEMKNRWSKMAEEKDMTLSQFIRHCVEVYITAYYNQRVKYV